MQNDKPYYFTLLLRTLSKAIIFCILSHTALATADKQLQQTNTTSTQTILIVGDSLSAGFGLLAGEEWPALLQTQLSSHHPKQFVIVNASISGETSLGGVQRLPSLLNKHTPQYLILALGANDGLQGQSLASMKANLTNMITMAKQHNTQVLLLGMHIPPNYGRRYSQAFHQVYAQLAQEMHIAWVPFFLEGIAGIAQLNQADGIHPIAKAQPMILNNIQSKLFTLLKLSF